MVLILYYITFTGKCQIMPGFGTNRKLHLNVITRLKFGSSGGKKKNGKRGHGSKTPKRDMQRVNLLLPRP